MKLEEFTQLQWKLTVSPAAMVITSTPLVSSWTQAPLPAAVRVGLGLTLLDPLLRSHLERFDTLGAVRGTEMLDLPRPTPRRMLNLDSSSTRRRPHRPHIRHSCTLIQPRLVRQIVTP